MANAPDAPRWDLLPHDPIGFFELAESFDRKDLKRAYNRLLRLFKPEKYPAEFQRIRAAFEELDEDLRYHGGASRARVPVPQDWQTDTSHASPSAESSPSPQAERKRLADRVASESPKSLFDELKARPNKTPYDYYALALLSDVVEKSPTGFANWLIEGIATHKQDGALRQLLHEYFRGPQSGKSLLNLLPLTAKAIRTDDFYPLTEPAWQVVLDECSFDDFTTAFDHCETELRDSHIVGRMAFLIHILKSAMWRDNSPTGWSARQHRFIEENFESIPPWLEWDVELLSLASEYLAVRDEFVSGSPLRNRMDAALKDYFSKSQEVGDQSIVAAQMEILASSEALLEEFPIGGGELFTKFYPIWAWASHDVAERQSIAQETEVNENVWASRAAVLLERLNKESNRSMTGILWSTCLLLRQFAPALISLALFFLLTNILGLSMSRIHEWMPERNETAYDRQVRIAFARENRLEGIKIVVSALVSVACWWQSRKILDQKLWFPLNHKFALKCYQQSWRRELMDFQRRSHVPSQFFRALFTHFSDKSATATWVNEFVQQDYAPALLADAQRYEA